MALQVWLPLSGNTTNFGLNGEEASTLNTVLYASGLFGRRAFYAGSGTVLIPMELDDSVFSLNIWFKGLTAGGWTSLISFGVNDDRIDISDDGLHYVYNCGSNGLIANGTTLFEVADEAWANLIITADGTNMKFYLNGTLECTAAQANTVATAFGANPQVYIGSKRTGNNCWSGMIQDVRVYDHVLSGKEILEVSKGLILNYTFNHGGFGNYNLAVGTEVDRNIELKDKSLYKYIERDNMYADLTAGTYTISAKTTGVWVKTNTTTGVTAEVAATNPCGLELYTKSNDQVDERTFYDMSSGSAIVTVTTAGRYYIGFILYGDGTADITATISQVKIESGSKATAWLPNVAHADFATLNIGSIESDLSGNELDGSISETAPLWSNDTALYSGSYDFSNGGYVVSPVFDVSTLSKFTISVWAKNSNMANQMLFGFDTAPRFNFGTLDGVFGIYDDDKSTVVPFGTGESVAAYNGDWHQYVIVADGTSETLYIDGELIGSTASFIAFGLSQLYISGWNTSNQYKWMGLMSDFRLYARPFSAEEVKMFYQARASIDNTGKFFMYEFSDLNDSVGVTKTGVVNVKAVKTAEAEYNADELTITGSVSGFNKTSIGANLMKSTDIYEL